MTPTEFEFTVKMPGDSRLVGAIRQLTAHAGGYAHLNAAATEQLASHVERATQAAMTASDTTTALFEFRFTATPEALVVTLSCDASTSAPHPASMSTNEVSVEWTSQGSRQVCRIRQRLTGA